MNRIRKFPPVPIVVDERLLARFWAKVSIAAPTECWLWTASRSHGYGQMTVGTKRVRRIPIRASRISWTIANGPIPEGMVVCHRCDVPACVNPAHLFIGTQGDNIRDAMAKGRLPRQPPVRRGEENANAKLSEDFVKQIRASLASGTALAKSFGVSTATISDIRSRRIWMHI